MTPFRPEDTPGILAAILDSSDDAIVTTDVEGVIRSWNPAAERLYGHTAEDVTGHPLSVIVPTDRGDELATILDRVAAGQPIEHYETVRQAKDGHLIDNAAHAMQGRGPIQVSLTSSDGTCQIAISDSRSWHSG